MSKFLDYDGLEHLVNDQIKTGTFPNMTAGGQYVPRSNGDLNGQYSKNDFNVVEYQNTATNRPTPNGWYFGMAMCGGDSDFGAQIAPGMTIDRIFWRNKRDGTPGTWREIPSFPGTAGVGSASQPVYVDSEGTVNVCSTALKCILDYGNVENQGAAAGKYGLLATMHLGNTANSQVNASFMLYFTDAHSNSTQSISQAELRINKRVGGSTIAMLTCYDSTFTDKVETIVTWNSSNYSIYVYLKSKTGTWCGVRGVPIQVGTHGGSTDRYSEIVLFKNTFSLSSTVGVAATVNTRTISYV